jgi:hypothetical protein
MTRRRVFGWSSCISQPTRDKPKATFFTNTMQVEFSFTDLLVITCSGRLLLYFHSASGVFMPSSEVINSVLDN